jgi:hypothetical protein
MTVKDTAVKKFLADCQPPLDDLLPTFELLGFKDREYLHGVATWPRMQLSLVLEKWKIAGMFSELQTESLKLAFGKLRTQLTNDEEWLVSL